MVSNFGMSQQFTLRNETTVEVDSYFHYTYMTINILLFSNEKLNLI